MRKSILIIATFLVTATSSPVQATKVRDRAAALATANSFLDSWREADNAKGEQLLHPDFRLTTLQGEGADRKVYTMDRAALLNASKSLKPNDWDDRLRNVEVRVGSNGIAVVTARYLFYQNGKPTHCGLVAMQLYKIAGDWKIISFADTHNNLNNRTLAEVCFG